MQEKLHEKYDFSKTQEILGQDFKKGVGILEIIYKEKYKKNAEQKTNKKIERKIDYERFDFIHRTDEVIGHSTKFGCPILFSENFAYFFP